MNKIFRSPVSLLLCLVLAASLAGAALPASAEAEVGLKVRPGLGGLYKAELPLELSVTVENTGPEFTGTITVKLDEEEQKRNTGLPRYTMDVRVPANSRERFNMVIPGELAAAIPDVELRSGGRILAESRVEGVAARGGRVILALSESIMGGGLQALLSGAAGPETSAKYLSPGELPGSGMLLGAADVIMVDGSGPSSFAADQVQALKEWVYLGGTLVLFGGAGSGEGECFSDISPVRASGRAVVDGKAAGLSPGAPLTVASGELVAGRALAEESGVPVLARRELGRGQVLYCGAAPQDLGAGVRELWATLAGVPGGTTEKEYYPVMPDDRGIASQDILTDVSSYIPKLAGPPVLLLALLWLAYAAAVGPLLYCVLRRKDRKDWAWALVPPLSLAAAGGFFLLAPSNRLMNYLSQTVATVEIFEPGLAEMRAGATVVVSRGGDFTVGAAENIYAVPSRYYEHPGVEPPLVRQDGGKVNIDFSGVEYGSMRKVFASGLRRDLGSVEGTLYFDGDVVRGDLVNKTGLDLRDSRLLLGGRAVVIDEFPAGGTAHIGEKLESWGRPNDTETLLPDINGGGRPDDPFFRERRMLSQFERKDTGHAGGVQFVGWHDGSPDIFEVSGKWSDHEDFGLVLVVQSIKLDLARGNFRLPAGFITPRQVETDGVPAGGPDGKMVEGSSFRLLYDIEDAGIGSNFRIESLYIQNNQGQDSSTVEIYDRTRDKWDPVAGEGFKIGAGELSKYLDDNKIVLRVTRPGNYRGHYPAWPGLVVEGVVS